MEAIPIRLGDARLRTLQRGVDRVPVRLLAVLVGATIAVLGVLGYLEDAGAAPAVFDLDGEGKPPAAFAALLLASAGCTSLLLHRLDGGRRWQVLGWFLVFMTVDEALAVHEHVSTAVGAPWVLLYLPVMAFGAGAWALLLRTLWQQRSPWPARAWLGGAAAWAIAVLLEEVQSGPETGRVDAYSLLATAEECLEMTGSALWLLALLAVVQVRDGARLTRAPHARWPGTRP